MWGMGYCYFTMGSQEKPYWEGDMQAEKPERVSPEEIRRRNIWSRGGSRGESRYKGTVVRMCLVCFQEEQSGMRLKWSKKNGKKWGQRSGQARACRPAVYKPLMSGTHSKLF